MEAPARGLDSQELLPDPSAGEQGHGNSRLWGNGLGSHCQPPGAKATYHRIRNGYQGAILKTRDKLIKSEQWFPNPHLGHKRQRPGRWGVGRKHSARSSWQLLPLIILSRGPWVFPHLSSVLKICPLQMGSKTPFKKGGWEDGTVGEP